MCRIAGIVSYSIPIGDQRAIVEKMCQAQKNGGPDEEGLFSDEFDGIVFGHRRLAIIDLSERGHQPMADTGSNIWITFNGEIYNFRELKAELLREGEHFNSNSDTEVILQAYKKWGMPSFSK